MALKHQTRSARGEIVDFDLLKIKQQLAASPKTTTVSTRESFIDTKFKRKLNRQMREAASMVEATVNTIPSAGEILSATENQPNPKK